MSKDNHLSWGVSLLFFGILFLIRQLNFLPDDISALVFNFKNYPIILGIIFFLFHKNKNIGLILLLVGILFHIETIIGWTKNISQYIWPLLLILAGIILVFGVKKGKK
ncbi:MAG: LiaF transmembrane domain-containing protein [Paludibacteraceae bacterium]